MEHFYQGKHSKKHPRLYNTLTNHFLGVINHSKGIIPEKT